MVKWALKNPHGVLVLVLAVAVLAGFTIPKMATDILPIYKTAAVLVVTFYPGMPPEIMEKDIASRIQRWTGQSVGIEHQEAKNMFGVSIVKDFFHEGVSSADAIAQVTAYAMSDLFYLPPGTIPPMTMPFDPTATFPLCLLAVSSQYDSEGKLLYDETALYDIAYYQLRNRMQSISGVVAPAVYGGKLRRIIIEVDPIKLKSVGLSLTDIVPILKKSSTLVPAGAIRLSNENEFMLLSNAVPHTVTDMNDFVIFVKDRRPVRIRDVGEVRDSAELQSNIVRIDGARQAYIPVYRQPGANTLQIIATVKEKLEPIKERLPPGVNLDVIFDQSVFVQKAIDNLLLEMIIGALLAALMILVFLRSVRTTVFILIQLPIAMGAALLGLHFTGYTINMMTLGGLALVIGMVLDEGIVSIENIARHIELGTPPRKAALDGMIEMARPRLLIMITVTVVFFPVIYLKGMGAYLFKPLAVSVAFAMFFSYLFTMTFLPMLASRFLKPHGEERGIAKALKGMLDGMQSTYRSILSGAIRARWLVLIVVGGVLAGSVVFIYPQLGEKLFPDVDAGQFMVRVREAPGTAPQRTEITCKAVEDAIYATIDPRNPSTGAPQGKVIQKMITNIGVLNDWPAAYTPNSGPGDAFVSIQLVPESDRDGVLAYVRRLRAALPGQFPGVEFSFDTAGILSAAVNQGVAAPINVQIEGKDLRRARGIAEKIRARVGAVEGIRDIRIQQQLNLPAYTIEIDREKAALMGISAEQVIKNVTAAFRSSITFDKAFWLDQNNGNHYFTGVQYSAAQMDQLQALEETPITPYPGAQAIPLKNLAHIERDETPAETTHRNITRVTDVYANIDERDLGAVARDVDEILDDMRANGEVPKGYRLINRGQVITMRESFDGLLQGLGLAGALVYLVMVLLFRSFLDPFIVMFAVPLGLIGVIWMLFLTGTTINIQSIMGVIMMVGIVVAFSILLVEFANQKRREGLDTVQAVIQASVARLRPIIMTSLAAVLGLTPMALHGGANIPLARAVIGGVLAATVLTLFVVPILYVLFRGNSPQPETE